MKIAIAWRLGIAGIVMLQVLGCGGGNRGKELYPQTEAVPPPPIPATDRRIYDSVCESLVAAARSSLHAGRIEIVYKDTISSGRRLRIFRQVIEQSSGMPYRSRYQLEFEPCIMLLMDSALASRFGPAGKDSIIHFAYRMADSIFTATGSGL